MAFTSARCNHIQKNIGAFTLKIGQIRLVETRNLTNMNQVLISSMQAINEKRFILSWLVFTITLSLYGYQIMEFGLGLQLFLVTGKLCWFLIEFDDEFFVYSYLKDLYETRIAQYERKLKTKGKFWDILLKKEPSTDRLYHLDALRGLACLIICSLFLI